MCAALQATKGTGHGSTYVNCVHETLSKYTDDSDPMVVLWKISAPLDRWKAKALWVLFCVCNVSAIYFITA